MSREKRYCQHCGASMNEHKHSISKSMVIGLDRLRKRGGLLNIKELGLTRNQWDNFQKLRYFGLTEQVPNEEGKTKQGVWRITQEGLDFLDGKRPVPKSAWSYRGKFVRFEGNPIFPTDADPDYKYREQYAEDSKAHRPSIKGRSLFDFFGEDEPPEGPRA